MSDMAKTLGLEAEAKARPQIGGIEIARDEERGCDYLRVYLSDAPTQEEMVAIFDLIAAWGRHDQGRP